MLMGGRGGEWRMEEEGAGGAGGTAGVSDEKGPFRDRWSLQAIERSRVREVVSR